MADRTNPSPVIPNPASAQPPPPMFFSPQAHSNMAQTGQLKNPAPLPNGPFVPPVGNFQPGNQGSQPGVWSGGQAPSPSNVNGFNPSGHPQTFLPPSTLNTAGFPPPVSSGQPLMSSAPVRPIGQQPPLPPSVPFSGPQLNGPGNLNTRPPLSANFQQPAIGQRPPIFQGVTPNQTQKTLNYGAPPSTTFRPPAPSISGVNPASGDVIQKPPSERSSRGPSPVSGHTIDALEGQFSPGHGAPSPAFPGNRGSPQPPQQSFVGSEGQMPGTPPKLTGAVRPPLQNQFQQQPWSSSQQQPGPYPQPGQYQANLPGQRPPPPQGFPPLPTPGQPVGFPPSAQQPRYPPPPGTALPPQINPPGFPPSNTNTAAFPPAMPTVPRFQPPPTVAGVPPPPSAGMAQPGMPPPPTGSFQPHQFRPGLPPSTPYGGMMNQSTHPPLPSQGSFSPTQFGLPSQQPGVPGYDGINSVTQGMGQMGFQDTARAINLLTERQLILPDGLETPKAVLPNDHKKVNCSPDIFRCTLNAIPQNAALLSKARLPLGVLIHPFRDLSQLPVIQSSVIVRCRSCRTYINPFVVFVDQRRWKCNLCFRINDLPDEFSFDPVSKTYGDPQRRPEVKSATIEFIAPSEYMLRPPQPAVYLYLLDVSFNAVKTGYLSQFCQILIDELDKLPGDARTTIGFLCYDKALYYFNLAEGLSQPQMLCVPDLEDPFLPCPDNLLVNLNESKELVIDLLNQLPNLFDSNYETGSALGAALQSAHKLMSATGGRITVMQTCLPTVGPGALENRDAASTAGKNVTNIGPATDFYKKLSLDCSAQQIAVDLFMLNGQYADIATLSCISKYSAGCIYYYPSFHSVKNPGLVDKFDTDLRRYLTRKIGFESVMRIRCTRGLSIHTFHGNFFVRSTDLLSLPNINPDAGFGMQVSIDDNLQESSSVSFQAALLYTSSKGERRIRVHTLCVPVTNQLSEVFVSADQQAIASLLSKMAVDRSLSSAITDARDAMMNASLDALLAYAQQIPATQRVGALLAPQSLRLMPMFMLAMLKSIAFSLGGNIKVDDRVFAMQQFKVLPLCYLIQNLYPHLYPLHKLNLEKPIKRGNEDIPSAPLIQLSSANIDRTGLFLMDTGEAMYLLVGSGVGEEMCQNVFDKPNFMSIPDGIMELPELDNPTSDNIRSFINYLMDSRPNGVTFLVIRDDSKNRHLFFQHMLEDRTENSMSYYEFLQFLQGKAKG
ncbi:protein transport protein Sec24A-like isoform X2 [Physella acuta]|uniref:protein transport protein Sec24A-like isoform X2 n=1 Tax=Physella acuta TaxID=109671 RepID=UPI0027DC6009|nr:protein transport protein Sec24A-like isoform X2 [Physella acuta]